MKWLGSLFTLLLKLLRTSFIIAVIWITFVYFQQVNYSEPDQVYLLGTHVAYFIVFVFALLFTIFFFRILKHRYNPKKLKKWFYLFSVFYLLMSPLVVLSFDNYFLVTQRGLLYNSFFSLDNDEIYRWEDIDKLTLDYHQEKTPAKSGNDLRLKFIVHFKGGPSVDLNNYNSPLYKKGQFEIIFRKLTKNGVPVEIARPLPETYQDPYSLVNELYLQSEKVEP